MIILALIQPIQVSLSSSETAQIRYTSWCPSTTFPSESVLQAFISPEELSAEYISKQYFLLASCTTLTCKFSKGIMPRGSPYILEIIEAIIFKDEVPFPPTFV